MNGQTSTRQDGIDHPDFAHTEISGAAATREEEALGEPGRPFSKRSPFFIGFMGALGVLTAYVLVRLVADLGTVLQLIGLSLFLAIGFDPAVVWLTEKRLPRWPAVLVVVLTVLLFIAGFVDAAVGPISREIHLLQLKCRSAGLRLSPEGVSATCEGVRSSEPTAVRVDHEEDQSPNCGWRSRGCRQDRDLGRQCRGHCDGIDPVLPGRSAVGAAPLPSARSAVPPHPCRRAERRGSLGVGGFVLGNLLTSFVAGFGTWVWLTIFGVPYPLLLGLLVAIFDLIPMVGSTIAGVIVSLVALTVSLPLVVATLAFYIGYRLFEDYLLTPRVMRHTVRISPGITIVAVLVGGVLLGLLGAVIAIPIAAGIQLILQEVTFPALERR